MILFIINPNLLSLQHVIDLIDYLEPKIYQVTENKRRKILH